MLAAGDIPDDPGKPDPAATGYAEAAIAIDNAAPFVDPPARMKPGHSTSMAIFKDQ